ncbi:DNA replication/repair protein RecF [Limoniibacter endophyticus]|uniref:DNA replication and repair protein RecF n=1 Tax=Limoniibacter endophyticus TaxID=1565040 RepID=A0A8J3DQL7_9HYPH|nr:DNA replication/repair protein RecF [Limoniibacter endophyticus]GHC67063.1 DNA replication and repair protein RecF [Limoniibacter endophyticus]
MREPDALPEHITRLSLTGFRNYASVSLSLAPGPVVLTGENGAGKTNLLEAVSLLAPGRGMRRAQYADIARTGMENGFAIHAELEGSFGTCSVGTGTSGMAPSEVGRRIRINGAQARSSDELLEWIRIIWLTPAMDTLFTGPAADRRRFLDRMVLTIDPAHAQRSLDFEKAMRSRNRLLSDNVRDALYFEALEVQMAETGTAIAAARMEVVRLLVAMIERLPDDSPFPKADLALAGSLEEELLTSGLPAVDVEELYRERLSRERERDRAAGRTLEGPHRSDLLVRHRPKGMPAEFCSTGEQKALLIGLVLSHARLCGELSSTVPILLLDEVAAHLDAGRRAALFSILEELRSQAFMTGTEPELFSALQGRAQFFAVSGGTVIPT